MKYLISVLLISLIFFTIGLAYVLEKITDNEIFVEYKVFFQEEETRGYLLASNREHVYYHTFEEFSGSLENLKSELELKRRTQNLLYVKKDFDVSRIESIEVLGSSDFVLLIEDLHQFQWELTDEKKNILGFSCQKAKTKYRCSEYTAWFTDSFSTSAGPWKLSGLPGLILELNNDTVGKNFLAVQVGHNDKTKSFAFSSYTPKIKRIYKGVGEFSKVRKKEFEKFSAFLRATMDDLPEGAIISTVEPECF